MPSETVPRGLAQREERAGRQEEKDDRGGDAVRRPVEVVHLASEKISHLVHAEAEAAAEQGGSEAGQVARWVLDRDPRRGADERDAVEEVADVLAAADKVPAD